MGVVLYEKTQSNIVSSFIFLSVELIGIVCFGWDVSRENTTEHHIVAMRSNMYSPPIYICKTKLLYLSLVSTPCGVLRWSHGAPRVAPVGWRATHHIPSSLILERWQLSYFFPRICSPLIPYNFTQLLHSQFIIICLQRVRIESYNAISSSSSSNILEDEDHAICSYNNNFFIDNRGPHPSHHQWPGRETFGPFVHPVVHTCCLKHQLGRLVATLWSKPRSHLPFWFPKLSIARSPRWWFILGGGIGTVPVIFFKPYTILIIVIKILLLISYQI